MRLLRIIGPDAQVTSPFFEVELQLDGTGVRLHPPIEALQGAINRSAIAILNCSKSIRNWETEKEATDADSGTPADARIYDRLREEKDIMKSLLLILGSIQNVRKAVAQYIVKFDVSR